MSSAATASVLGYLYAAPELKTGERGPWCRIKFWTSDKVKDEKQFTSWSGIVHGPQAEWAARDGYKNAQVFVTGSVRQDKYTKDDGTVAYVIEFTRIHECRVVIAKTLEGRPTAVAESPPAPRRPAAPAAPPPDDEPPF